MEINCKEELDALKNRVDKRLGALKPLFGQIATGDFSSDVPMYEEDDEFTEFYTGIQIMLEVVRDRLKELDTLNNNLEEKIASRTAALEEAQEIAHIGSWEWEIPSNKVYWSSELYRIFGLTPNSFGATYEAYLKYIHPDDRKLVDATMQSACATGRPFTFFTRIIRPDSKEKILHVKGRVTMSPSGDPIKIIGTAEDVTEQNTPRELLERQANELEKINNFIASRESTIKQLQKELAMLRGEGGDKKPQ